MEEEQDRRAVRLAALPHHHHRRPRQRRRRAAAAIARPKEAKGGGDQLVVARRRRPLVGRRQQPLTRRVEQRARQPAASAVGVGVGGEGGAEELDGAREGGGALDADPAGAAAAVEGAQLVSFLQLSRLAQLALPREQRGDARCAVEARRHGERERRHRREGVAEFLVEGGQPGGRPVERHARLVVVVGAGEDGAEGVLHRGVVGGGEARAQQRRQQLLSDVRVRGEASVEELEEAARLGDEGRAAEGVDEHGLREVRREALCELRVAEQ